MATPQPPYGYRPPPIAKRQSRLAGIVLAVTGLLLLPCVLVVPWAGREEGALSLREIWRFTREAPWSTLSYEMPFYLALAGVAVALLAGLIVVVLGNRPANIVAILFGLLASVLAFGAVAWYFFRSDGYNYLPEFFTEYAHVGFYGTWLLSLLLLVGVVLALVGAIRAGKPKAPRPGAPFAPSTGQYPPRQPGQPQQPGQYPPPAAGPYPPQPGR